jgi:hypothetical protein
MWIGIVLLVLLPSCHFSRRLSDLFTRFASNKLFTGMVMEENLRPLASASRLVFDSGDQRRPWAVRGDDILFVLVAGSPEAAAATVGREDWE